MFRRKQPAKSGLTIEFGAMPQMFNDPRHEEHIRNFAAQKLLRCPEDILIINLATAREKAREIQETGNITKETVEIICTSK